MDFSLIFPNIIKLLGQYWEIFLITGVKNTLILTAISVAMGTVLGTVVAMLKMSKFKLIRFIVALYVEVIRGTPILLQLYVFYFVIPQALKFLDMTPFMWVAVALCVNSAAYVSEVIRSGIQAVDKGQTEAARSLGLSSGQTMMKIVLPQAVRNILPALGNEFVTMIKETSIIQYLGIGDLMYNNGIVITATYNPLPCYYISAVIYLVLNIVLGKGLDIFERRMKRSER